LYDILTSVCTGGPNKTIPVIISVNFHQVRPLLKYGRVQTLVDRLTRP